MSECKGIKEILSAKYGNESKAARAIGWSRQRLNMITNGKKEPSLEEVRLISAAVEMPFEKTAAFFIDL